MVRQVESSKVYQQIRIKLHTDHTSALAIYNPQALELRRISKRVLKHFTFLSKLSQLGKLQKPK